jgi:hypothetical protein
MNIWSKIVKIFVVILVFLLIQITTPENTKLNIALAAPTVGEVANGKTSTILKNSESLPFAYPDSSAVTLSPANQ